MKKIYARMHEKWLELYMVTLHTNNWSIEDIDAILFDKDGTFQHDHTYWGKLAECRIQALIEYFNLSQDSFNDLCFAIGHNPIECKLIKNGPVGTLSKNEVVDGE